LCSGVFFQYFSYQQIKEKKSFKVVCTENGYSFCLMIV
jgi:hypothetical protein